MTFCTGTVINLAVQTDEQKANEFNYNDRKVYKGE